MQTPLVKDTISISFDSQDACEATPQKPQKRGPGRPRLPESQKKPRERRGEPTTLAGWRYRIRRDLTKKLGQKHRTLYQCPGCFKRKKLRLYRVNKNHNPPGESDYLLLCPDCVTQEREKGKKIKLWSRKPGPRGGSPESAKLNFFSQIKPFVLQRDRQCVWCGSKEKLRLCPLIPPSRGGKLCFGNYVMACEFCAASKSNKMPLEYIWEKISFDYWMSGQLYHEPTATPGLVTQRINLHLVAEISQFLMRIAVNEDIEGRIKNKAERLNIKLSETDEDRHRERVEVGSWIG
ncbi:hypothetical protein ES703_08678 [subsurface metagenome]